MIQLTRLNGNDILLNCDLIKHAEAAPDTVLSLVTGEKLIVRESCSEVAARILAYRASTYRAAWPEATSPLDCPVSPPASAYAPHTINPLHNTDVGR